MENLIFLICFSFLSIFSSIIMLCLSYLFSYKIKDKLKSSTYECGMKPIKSAKVEFHINYINYIILTLLFETSFIFIYPFLVSNIGDFAISKIIVSIYMCTLLIILILSIKFKLIGKNK